MKKGELIASIRRLARTGENFAWHHFSGNKVIIQQVLSAMARRGELKVMRAPITLPAIYQAGSKILAVDTLQPNNKPKRILPGPGEITLKQWLIEEAEREGTTASAIAMRYRRNRYPNLPIRRVNCRTVFVVNQKP